jgi:hypothetical protein
MATPRELLDRAEGKSAGEIAAEGLGGFVLAISVAAITGLQTVVEFLLLPLDLLTQAGIASVQNLIIRPLGLTGPALAITADGLQVFGLFALPVSVVIIILTLIIVVGAAAIGWTGWLPGTVLDNPVLNFFFATPEEEEEEDAI